MEERMKYKPGPGWTRIKKGPVWDHESGVRIHAAGLIRTKGMTNISHYDTGHWDEIDRFIRINGGNKKRGIMAYSLTLKHPEK